MKKSYFLMLLFSSLFAGYLEAKQLLVNTSNSDFSYLRGDTCFYDDQINTVSCKDHGTFQNVKKAIVGSQKSKDAQLIGSLVAADGKSYDLYAMSPLQAIAHTQDLLATIKATAAVFFNPVQQAAGGTTKPNPYALVSKNEVAIDALFGSKGLNVDKTIIQYFKNFYFYLEYVVRLEYAARAVDYAHQNNIADVVAFLENKTWKDLIALLENKAGGWESLEKKLFDKSIKPDWNALRGLIKASSWQELVTTPFWISFDKISNAGIIRSSFWQKYVKYIITRSFVQDQQLLLSIKQVEGTIFKYIPNIEVAYYTPDFTSLRNASEMFHINLILTDALRNRHIGQCDEWHALGDSLKIYTVSVDYKALPFYSIASYAQENQESIYSSVAQKKDPIKIPLDNEQFKKEPLLQEELLLLSMIQILHALTNYLYDSTNLEHTMDILANKTIAKPQPSIFLYAPEDYLYLEDLNILHDSFKNDVVPSKSSLKPMAMARGGPAAGMTKDQKVNALFNAVLQSNKNTNPQVKVQGFFGDLWSDIAESGNKVWGDMKKFGNDFVNFVYDANSAVWDEMKSLGYGSAAAFLSGIDPAEATKLLKDSIDLQNEVAHHVNEAKKELEDTVTDVENVANDSVEFLGDAMKSICDRNLLANKDPELCKALKGAFTAAFEFLISSIAGELKEFVSISGGIIKLTADGIALVAKTAAYVATSSAVYGAELLEEYKTFGADMAVAVLEPLTIQFQYFVKTLGDVLKFCQYFISIITRLFIDATTAITLAIAGTFGEFANLFGANISPGDWAKSVDDALTEHERLIGTAITTALLLATIPLTGGASAVLIVMTLGPQLFAAYASFQADEEATKQKEEEKAFADHFTDFVNTNSLIYRQQQNEWSKELQLKYRSELENQERNLGFYENFLANNLEALKEQYAESLGSYWAQLLQPDASYYTLIPADVGAVYGFTTGVYGLNPSQGFSLYSAARKSFSQEIAVLPALAVQSEDQTEKQVELKNWFNQKEVIILDKPVNEVEIRFQAIYLLNSFYIGLYFGGQDINLSEIKNSKSPKAPIDLGQFAKMAVYKKEEAERPVTFGVYEHESPKGDGWLMQSMNSPKFQLGTWYHIKMILQGNTLQVKVWQEPNAEPGTAQSFSVSPTSQKVIGVISSGASIEYQFIKPQVTVTPNSAMRPKDQFGNQNRCTIPCDKFKESVPLQIEKEREKTARVNLDYLMSPSLQGPSGNTTNLTAVNKTQILRGHYIYTTEKTKLNIDGKVVEDYVVPCEVTSYGAGIVPGLIGSRPQTTSYMVSLVSESLFNGDADYSNAKLKDIYATYTTESGPLSDALDRKITELHKKYVSQGATFDLGAFKLQVNKDALQNKQYVYMASMKDVQGNLIKDKQGTPLQDYFLLTILDTAKTRYDHNTQGNPGVIYSEMLTHEPDTRGITSLVSGNLYGSKDAKPLHTFDAGTILTNYQKNYDDLPDSLQKVIKQAQADYKDVIRPSGTPSDTPNTGSSTKKISDKDIATKTGNKEPDTGKPEKPADKSIQQKADEASGGDYSWGGPT